MTKTQIIEGINSNITAKLDLIEVVKLVKEKAKTISHYQAINGRYTSQLETVIPLTGSYKQDNGTVKTYREYTVAEGYKNFDGGLTCIEIKAYRMYKDKYFARIGRNYEYYNGRYERSIRIGGGMNTVVTPMNILESFDPVIEMLSKEVEDLRGSIVNIDAIIQRHNDCIKYIIEHKNYMDKISYSVRGLLPEVQLPFLNENSDLISDN